MLMAFRSNDHKIFQAITNSLTIDTVLFKHCIFSQLGFVHIGFVLSTKMNHLERLTLCRCFLIYDDYQELLNDHLYQEFSKMFFHNRAVIHYLKELNISYNNITSHSVNAIISSLQSCVIEKLVISDKALNGELVSSVFAKGYHQGGKILNFLKGTPLIIINTEKSNNSSTNCFTAFVINCIANDYCISLFSDISNYQIYCYNLFLINSSIVEQCLNYAISSLQCLMCIVKEVILYGTDLTDEVAIMINQCIYEAPQLTSEHFLVSETKLMSRLSKAPSVSNSRLIDIVGSKVAEKMFEIFCKSVFSEVGCNIVDLDISGYQLTSACIDILISSLENYSVEKLTLSNNEYHSVLNQITDGVLNAYATGKRIQNFLSGIPLTIFCYTGVKDYVETWVGLFCLNVHMRDEYLKQFADFLVKKTYSRILCIFLNSFANDQKLLLSTCKFLSKCLESKANKVFVYNVGLRDVAAKIILEHISAAQEQVRYVIVSLSMFLAYRVDESMIIKTLADILHFSATGEFSSMFSSGELTTIKFSNANLQHLTLWPRTPL